MGELGKAYTPSKKPKNGTGKNSVLHITAN